MGLIRGFLKGPIQGFHGTARGRGDSAGKLNARSGALEQGVDGGVGPALTARATPISQSSD